MCVQRRDAKKATGRCLHPRWTTVFYIDSGHTLLLEHVDRHLSTQLIRTLPVISTQVNLDCTEQMIYLLLSAGLQSL